VSAADLADNGIAGVSLYSLTPDGSGSSTPDGDDDSKYKVIAIVIGGVVAGALVMIALALRGRTFCRWLICCCCCCDGSTKDPAEADRAKWLQKDDLRGYNRIK
jgi:hypothetical protein